jgi:ferredoxin
MTYMITAECINCTACATDCPVEAISPGPSQFLIDPEVCVECEGFYETPRCWYVCPVGACVPFREMYMAKARTMTAKNAPPVRYIPGESMPVLVRAGWYEQLPIEMTDEDAPAYE